MKKFYLILTISNQGDIIMGTSLRNKFMAAGFTFLLSVFISGSISMLQASDSSDAADIRKKCETEFKAMEIPVKNFGNPYVKQYYTAAAELLKDGKVKLAQSKFQEAIAVYNKVLSLYKDIYKELTADYIKRTEMIYNDTAAELADFIDDTKVAQYFKLANQNVVDAKKALTAGNYNLVIETCRISKKYSFSSYTAAGKQIPDKYKKDIKDNNKEIE